MNNKKEEEDTMEIKKEEDIKEMEKEEETNVLEKRPKQRHQVILIARCPLFRKILLELRKSEYEKSLKDEKSEFDKKNNEITIEE